MVEKIAYLTLSIMLSAKQFEDFEWHRHAFWKNGMNFDFFVVPFTLKDVLKKCIFSI